MVLAGQLPVRARDVFRDRRLGHAEHVVIVLLEPLSLRSHRGSPSRIAPHAVRDQSRTLTRAGRKTRPFQTYPVRNPSATCGPTPSPSSCMTASWQLGSKGSPNGRSTDNPDF